MKQNITPLNDRVVIKRLEEQTTSGGIIIPDTDKEKTQFGEVVAAGPGKEKALGVKVGDRVIFGKYSGTEIKFEGNDLLIVKEDEILGIIR